MAALFEFSPLSAIGGLLLVLLRLSGSAAELQQEEAACSALLHGFDFLNEHHQSVMAASSPAECCAHCDANPACKAFTYQTEQHKCYMKANNAGQTKNPACISGCKGGKCPPSPPAPPHHGPSPPTGPPRQPCVGEFTRCASGECTMSSRSCGSGCKPGQYVCPSDQKTCVAPDEYSKCPGMKGTHLDPTLDIEKRLDYIVQHTNLTEQISQLQNTAPEIYELGIAEYQWLNDDQHGVARTPAHATVFANGVGLGAGFSHETIHAVGAVVGEEARGLHNGFLASDPDNRQMGCNGCSLTMYAPNLNLIRDVRWGRAQEVYGEDPIHMAELVTEFVTGAQNNSIGKSVGDAGFLQAGTCCKHFAAYDIENIPTSRQTFNAELTSRDMWETYMPAFEACIKDGKSSHVMCSYNQVNGNATCGNHGLLTTILRDTWKWDGFVVSDYDAWAEIWGTHHQGGDAEGGAAKGLNAGIDQEGGGHSAIDQLAQAVKDGKTTQAEVERALRNLFRLRIRLGMLDPPLSVPYYKVRYNDTELQFNQEHVAVAKKNVLADTCNATKAALEAMTLYKNEKSTLPLSDTKDKKIALIGPQGSNAGLLFGNYAGSANGGNWGMSIAQALTARLAKAGGTLTAVPGLQGIGDPTSADNFAAAAAAAKAADVTVVTLGLAFDKYCQHNIKCPENKTCDVCESEGHDRQTIELASGQVDMVAALRAAIGPTKKLVAVLIHGGTMAFPNATLDALDAVLDAWYPGLGGGEAVAATLFGDQSPAGRSSQTWYSSNADLPDQSKGYMGLYPNVRNGNPHGVTYRYYQGPAVRWPFGYGLSYTTFEYSGVKLDKPAYQPCEVIMVTVTVKNTGTVDSDEVVQIYIKQPEASVPAPRVRLAAFARVHVPKATSKTVTLAVKPAAHTVVTSDDGGEAIYVASADVEIEKGDIELYVGGGQPDYYNNAVATKASIAAAAPLSSCDK